MLLLLYTGVQYENVLMIVTDAAAYMLSAVSALKTLFPKMIHLTCFAHGIHRLSEFIRYQFPAVNELISSTKAVFFKVDVFITNCRTNN